MSFNLQYDEFLDSLSPTFLMFYSFFPFFFFLGENWNNTKYIWWDNLITLFISIF